MLIIANSLLFRSDGGNGKSEQELKNTFTGINNTRCEPPLDGSEIREIWKDAVAYHRRKTKDTSDVSAPTSLKNEIKRLSKKDKEEEEGAKTYTVYKYSTGIPLAEEIILGNRGSVFLQIHEDNDRPVISPVIDLSKEKNIILIPHDHGVISPIIPYHFEDEKGDRVFHKTGEKRDHRYSLL